MGFWKAMKGVNNAWGHVVSSEGVGTIGPENFINNTAHRLLITVGFKTVTFDKKDVRSLQTIAATSEWIRYLLVLKNGKKYTLTFIAFVVNKKGKTINPHLMNFEWWMFDLLYSEQALLRTASTSTATTQASASGANTTQASVPTTAKPTATTTSTANKPRPSPRIQNPPTWICRKCGAKNSSSQISCNSCGEYQ